MSRPNPLFAALLVAFALGGCGLDPDSPEPGQRPVESVDLLAPLPPGWKAHVNSDGGFAFALPPGWDAQNRGSSTLVRSYDQLAVVSISADRTREALELPLEAFATRALAARPGYEEALRPSEPRELQHRYASVVVEAQGTAKGSGVAQQVELVVLRRSKLVTLTVVIAVNASPEGEPSELIAERIVETLRSRPTGGGV